ncbi:hypothetical protein [Paracoccus tegillarcae]|uniref:Uncharacterized protein n=1 Tax=Paracoccus tegillarcae TaxID=1529068 RepID=A0A2K9EGW0_9RHOB|nr:hypothetical protein [Paracoccus tegillarcae]AUH34183.1 hypothetical protein CUV01_12955 [Paracoccus tegillarcae]
MMMHLDDFLEKYDLYDKAVLSIAEASQDSVLLSFDLYSEDDPDRNDYGKEYLLLVTIPRSQIKVITGPLFISEPECYGQVLEDSSEGKALFIGIEWSRYSNNYYEWSKLQIGSGALDTKEVIVERKQ